MKAPSNPSLIDVREHGLGTDAHPLLEYSSRITLRDLFAAAALAGDRANPTADAWNETDRADAAYAQADAMLAARERTGGGA